MIFRVVEQPEPTSHTLANPARVVEGQFRFIQIADSSRYYPCISPQAGGIILIKDLSDGDASIEMVEVEEWSSFSGESIGNGKSDAEAPKPSPFEFDFTYY